MRIGFLLVLLAGCTTEEAACRCEVSGQAFACGQAALVDGECLTCTSANVTAATPGLCDTPSVADMATPSNTQHPDLAKADAKPSSSGCPSGFTNCAGVCVDLTVDSEHCGSCDTSCSALPNVYKGSGTCKAGVCQIASNGCMSSFGNCNGDPSDGCEAQLTTNDHCGSCPNSCGGNTPVCTSTFSGYSCQSGCSYPTPTLCSGSCVDLSTNADNCGMCGNPCVAPAHGAAVCASYACKITCDPGFVACPAGCCSAWPVTTADPLIGNGPIGAGDLVLDANQVEHVVYVSKKLQELIYWRSDTATLERIDGPFAPGATVEDAKILRTSDGVIHVVYVVQQTTPLGRDLWHAQRGASSWVKDKLDSSAQLGGAQLAKGAAGALFVYFQHTTAVSRLMTRSAAGVYTSEDVSVRGIFAATPAGVPALAYAVSGTSAIQFGLHGAGGFTFEDVGQTGSIGGLSFDAAGHPYIRFYNNAYKEAHKLDTFWETLTLGASSSIRFDSQGVPYASGVTSVSSKNSYFLQKFTTTWANTGTPIAGLSYYDTQLAFQLEPNAVPHYLVANQYQTTALNTLSPGKSPLIDSERKPGSGVQMATDAAGTVHVLYSDGATRELWYATRKAGVWTQEKLPTTSATFEFALSPSGFPAVCIGSSSVTYLSRSGGVWTSETLAGVSSVLGCSLAFDANSKPHLAYSYGPSYAAHVGYARKTGASWEKFDVEAVNSTGADTAIAIEPSSGNPHVAFTSSSSLSLILGRWNGTRFVQQTLASSLTPNGAFLYDASGTAHLLLGGGTGGVTYGSIVGTTFASEALITDSGRSGTGSLILGAQGPIVALLSSAGSADTRLSIARKSAGTWSTENVAAVQAVGPPALALSSGKLLAGLYDSTVGRLLLAAQP